MSSRQKPILRTPPIFPKPLRRWALISGASRGRLQRISPQSFGILDLFRTEQQATCIHYLRFSMAPLPCVSHVASGATQSPPHFQNVDRKSDEGWDSFVARAAVETLACLRAFKPNTLRISTSM